MGNLKKEYSRFATLICPTCASDQFEDVNPENGDQRILKCGSCNLEVTYENLQDHNTERLMSVRDEMSKEIMDDAKKDVKASLKRAFGKSNFIKIK